MRCAGSGTVAGSFWEAGGIASKSAAVASMKVGSSDSTKAANCPRWNSRTVAGCSESKMQCTEPEM
eukprot:6348125-Alexandrium_andersonii.AAC.1